jgi:hypothetical protein
METDKEQNWVIIEHDAGHFINMVKTGSYAVMLEHLLIMCRADKPTERLSATAVILAYIYINRLAEFQPVEESDEAAIVATPSQLVKSIRVRQVRRLHKQLAALFEITYHKGLHVKGVKVSGVYKITYNHRTNWIRTKVELFTSPTFTVIEG